MNMPEDLCAQATGGARVMSINVGRMRSLHIAEGLSVGSGIIKRSVSNEESPTDVEVRKLGLVGDEQADLSVHGGLDKAVYLYPFEHYAWWKSKRTEAQVPDAATPLRFGALGENLTVRGLLENEVWVGDCLIVGDVQLRVEAPRNPCFKLNAAMGYRLAVKHMLLSGRAGIYLSVVEPGIIRAGMAIEVVAGAREQSIIDILALRRGRARREP